MDLDRLKPRSRPDVERIERVKGWVTSALELPASTSVMVTELALSEPGSPRSKRSSLCLPRRPEGAPPAHVSQAADGRVVGDVIHLANLWHLLDG